MGLSVNLFKLEYDNSNEYWEFVDCLYQSMIGPSRDKISKTYYNEYNTLFKWGIIEDNHFDDDRYLTYYSQITVSKMTFLNLKKLWKNALGEELTLDNNINISDNSIICLATGN